ncbi:MHYT domain-containing protein [Streptomyces sp. NBC_00728]|uniref:MHYT domain-containing protein n=1 Tax=Streptomyces sp. NBC_00728 TaxID=2903676 RepID=UPI003862E250
MARFRARRTKQEWMWLAFGSVALGSGLWGMHLIVWLGLGTHGTVIGHDGPLTVLSGLVCVCSTTFGLLLADVRRTPWGLVAAGAVLAGGLVWAQALGVIALDVDGGIHLSIGAALTAALVAAIGATATLSVSVSVGSKVTALGASLLTGAVLCSAQYICLAGVTVPPEGTAAGQGTGLGGAAGVVPPAAVLTLVVLTVAFNLYMTPVRDVRDTPAPLVTREMPWYLTPGTARPIEFAPAAPAVAPVIDEQSAIEADPVVTVAG